MPWVVAAQCKVCLEIVTTGLQFTEESAWKRSKIGTMNIEHNGHSSSYRQDELFLIDSSSVRPPPAPRARKGKRRRYPR